MISLITGLPGNGKTLFALWYIKHKAEKEQRDVYYHNIKDLTLPWTVCDPEKWMDLPKGAIIVLDEAQFVFPKKPSGSKLPEWYEKLAVHRHSGFDIYLITQHPSLIDNFVRQLVGQHFHSVRKFGLQRSTIYEWSAANPAPQNPSSHKSAVSLKWSYPKEVFGYYKSAEVHTVKRSVPMKLILGLLFIVAVPVGGWYALDRYQHRYDKPGPKEVASSVGAVVASSPASAPQSEAKPAFDALSDARQYVAMQTPRVQGLPQTAPKYDALTVPVRVPVPAMCVQVGSVSLQATVRAVTCKCYSQQATPMAVPFEMCIEFARNGYFRDFDPDRDQQATAKTQQGAQVLSNRQDVSIATGQPVLPLVVPVSSPVVYSMATASGPASQRDVVDPVVNDGPVVSRPGKHGPPFVAMPRSNG